MLTKVAGIFKATLQRVNIAGVWKEVDVGWVKNGTVWNRFKFPYIAKDITVRLAAATGQNPDGTTFQRRSAIRSGNGPAAGGTPGAFVQGSCSVSAFTINGATVQLRGIETGSDVVSGQAAWKWVSLQFFGNVNIKYLARVLKLNGLQAYNIDASYQSATDITFMTFYCPDGVMPATGVDLKISF
jgi:hypothetical protein